MPLPKPKKNEKRSTFMNRCMSNSTMNSEYPDKEQRYAVCNARWKDRDKAIQTNKLIEKAIKEWQKDH